jgi:hypothetical protein
MEANEIYLCLHTDMKAKRTRCGDSWQVPMALLICNAVCQEAASRQSAFCASLSLLLTNYGIYSVQFEY